MRRKKDYISPSLIPINMWGYLRIFIKEVYRVITKHTLEIVLALTRKCRR